MVSFSSSYSFCLFVVILYKSHTSIYIWFTFKSEKSSDNVFDFNFERAFSRGPINSNDSVSFIQGLECLIKSFVDFALLAPEIIAEASMYV